LVFKSANAVWNVEIRVRPEAVPDRHQGNGRNMIDTAPTNRRPPSLKRLVFLIIGFAMGSLVQTAAADVTARDQEVDHSPAATLTPSEMTQTHLYFADRNNVFLKSEQRVMERPADQTEFARAIVAALIRGPQTGLNRTIPDGTELRAIYIAFDSICYVDFSNAVKKNHPGGSNTELLTIYSVVNSLILNLSEIKRVKILIDGRESSTLAGHITLQQPFKAHMLIIR
jgi:spore germination protein GerM